MPTSIALAKLDAGRDSLKTDQYVRARFVDKSPPVPQTSYREDEATDFYQLLGTSSEDDSTNPSTWV
ncbi:hypothetical protein G3M48_001604 [Beauveria asiatica]|uniref:Uncharacterized protein n=1 Tax=Beauveria asiatica TaxID=1069075 RepID=A0AAW0RZY4_9HYPO